MESVLITLVSKLPFITAVIYNIYGVLGKQLQKLNMELTTNVYRHSQIIF